MGRQQIKEFLRLKIKEEEKKIKKLGKSKAEADTAMTSWSSHQIQDIEQEISQHTSSLLRRQAILECLENTKPGDRVGLGSIIELLIEGKNETCLLVNDRGGSVGRFLIISRQSPIGKAIWKRKKGKITKVKTPKGTISIEILDVI